MVGRERKFADVSVVGWRAALWHCEGQVIDKERDIGEVKNNKRVLSNGLTQLQPMRSVLQPLTIGSRYLPFMLVLGVHAKHVLHSPQG